MGRSPAAARRHQMSPDIEMYRQTHLLAFEESFSVTVGEVQRQRHDTRSVLHSLNDPVQFSPAGALWRNTATDFVFMTSFRLLRFCNYAKRFKITDMS